jgi:hypothetical protein
MRKMIAAGLLAACCLAAAASASCGGGPGGKPAGEETVDGLVSDVNALAGELTNAVETAPDPSAGVDAAQARLDERRGALKERLARVRAGREFRESEDARNRLLECEVDTTDRVSKLRTRHLELWMKDANFKSRLDRLVAGYQDIFK